MNATIEKATDKKLREAVIQHLEWSPEIASQDIRVSAQEGAVTLTGFVHNYIEKIAAERATKSLYGVKAVANEIEVRPGTRTDPEIARDVLEAMRIDITVPNTRLKISLQDGIVTMEGILDWNYQRNSAESCVRKVKGVRGVVNKIELKPKVSTTEVKAKIEEALRRSADVDARRINVSAEDGAVTLSGNVRSWVERHEALRTAWAAPGVSRVFDHITVVP